MTRYRLVAVALGVAAWGAATGEVSAQSAVLMAPGAETDGRLSRAAEAARGALQDGGARFSSARVPSDCDAIDCGVAAAESAGVERLVMVQIWPRSGQVEVVVVDVAEAAASAGSRGHTAARRALGTDGSSLDTAAASAAAAAWSAQDAGAAAPTVLRIGGTAVGAAVLIDGRPAGAVPFDGTVASGTHTIRVQRGSERVIDEQITVEPGAAPIVLTTEGPPVAVDDVSGPSSNANSGGSGRSSARFVPPIALMGLGAAALAGVGVAAARTGCLESLPTGRCVLDRRLRVGPTVALASVGALALAAGLVWALRLRLGDHTEVAIVPGGFRVAGTF